MIRQDHYLYILVFPSSPPTNPQVIVRILQIKRAESSISPDSAVELVLADGLSKLYVLVGADGDVTGGVELGGTLAVDLAVALLLVIGGKLDSE